MIECVCPTDIKTSTSLCLYHSKHFSLSSIAIYSTLSIILDSALDNTTMECPDLLNPRARFNIAKTVPDDGLLIKST